MTTSESSSTPTIKVLVLGEKSVGKTCLIKSLLNEALPQKYEPTQDNWYSSPVQISDKKSQKIHYLDTGSYDDFPELVECYIKMAHIFIVVLDYSYKRTYLSARRIVRDIRSVRGHTAAVICVSTKCDKLKGGEHPVRVFDELEHIMCSSTLNVGLCELRKMVTEQVKCILKDFDNTKLSRKSKFATSMKKLLRLKKPMRRSETTSAIPPPTTPSIIVSASNTSTPSSTSSVRSVRSARARCAGIRRSASMNTDTGVSAYTFRTTPPTSSRSMHSSRTDIHKVGTLSSANSCTSMNKQVTDIFKKYGYERKSSHIISKSPMHSPTMNQMSLRVMNSTSAAWKSLQSSVNSMLNTN